MASFQILFALSFAGRRVERNDFGLFFDTTKFIFGTVFALT